MGDYQWLAYRIEEAARESRGIEDRLAAHEATHVTIKEQINSLTKFKDDAIWWSKVGAVVALSLIKVPREQAVEIIATIGKVLAR